MTIKGGHPRLTEIVPLGSFHDAMEKIKPGRNVH